jgi:hypothetical protein
VWCVEQFSTKATGQKNSNRENSMGIRMRKMYHCWPNLLVIYRTFFEKAKQQSPNWASGIQMMKDSAFRTLLQSSNLHMTACYHLNCIATVVQINECNTLYVMKSGMRKKTNIKDERKIQWHVKYHCCTNTDMVHDQSFP